MNESAATATLEALADTFVEQGCVPQAIKCLEAACLAYSVPGVDLRLRLRLAGLLLDHADNAQEARAHMEKARSKLDRSTPPGLHCRVLSELGRCQRHLGEVRLQRMTYKQALDLLGAKNKGKMDSFEHLQWVAHFQLRLADAHVSDDDPKGAASCLAEAMRVLQGADAPELEMQVQLFGMQLDLLAGDLQAAGERDARCQELMLPLRLAAAARTAAAAALASSEGTSGPPLLHAQLRAHMLLLRVLREMAEGDLRRHAQREDAQSAANTTPGGGGGADGAVGAGPASLVELDDAVRDASRGPWQYEWLPVQTVAPLVDIVASQLLGISGRWAEVQTRLDRASGVVDGLMRSLGMDAMAGEHYLSRHLIQEWRLLPVLRALCEEQRAAVQLTTCNPQAARPHLGRLAAMLEACPAMLSGLKPGAHLVSGHYGLLCGDASSAAAHYRRALDLAGPQPGTSAMQAAASLCLAVALMQPGEEGGPAQASEALRACGAEEMVQSTVPNMERACALLSTGLVLRALGAEAGQQGKMPAGDAKIRLGKALKLAHTLLGNHQLVTQVLLSLAPLQQERNDRQGAINMVTSSYTLARSMGDLVTQISCLHTMLDLEQDQRQGGKGSDPTTPGSAPSSLKPLQRKGAELGARVKMAVEADPAAHAAAVAWGLE